MARAIPKSAEQLWKQLERDTGREVSPVERKWLEDDRMVEIALDPAESEGYGECAAALRRLRQAHKALLGEAGEPRVRSSHSKSREVRLAGIATKNEARRAEIVARWVSRQVLRSRDASEIRKYLLRDPARDLSPLGVIRLIESPATSYLSPHFFLERGIPITGHEAELIHRKPRFNSDLVLEEDVELLIRWRRKKLRHRFTLRGKGRRMLLPPIRLRFRTGSREPFETWAYQGSCLWLLAEACREVGAAHGWNFTETVWLLLSGIPPDRKPVRIRSRAIWDREGRPLSALITVTAKPFVSSATIARAYERARKALLRARPLRPMGAKAVTLFEFVDSRRDPDAAKIPWSSLMREWDKQAPAKWRYKDRGHFMRDYLRAKRLLVEEGLPKPNLRRTADDEPPEGWMY